MTRKAVALFITEYTSQKRSRVSKPIFFSDQFTGYSKRERRKKQVWEIPESLQSAYSNPITTGMTSKEKAIMKLLLNCDVDNLPELESSSDKTSHAVNDQVEIAAPPAIATPTVIEVERKHSASEDEETQWDEQRLLFQAARLSAGSVLTELSALIDFFAKTGKKVKLSHRLEYQLQHLIKYEEEKYPVHNRRWQTKTAATDFKKRLADQRKQKLKAERTKSGSTVKTGTSGSENEDMATETKSIIADDASTASALNTHEPGKDPDRRAAQTHLTVQERPNSVQPSEGGRSLTNSKAFTVRFVLSSSEATSNGWVLSDSQLLRQQVLTALEWCVNRMRFLKKTSQQNSSAFIRRFDDKPQKTDVSRLRSRPAQKTTLDVDLTDMKVSNFLDYVNRLKPAIPSMKSLLAQIGVQVVSLADETVCVFYASGRVCALRSASVHYFPPEYNEQLLHQRLGNLESADKNKFYTYVFSDHDDSSILAAFGPNGNGVIFQPKSSPSVSKTVYRLELNDDGYTHFDGDGSPLKAGHWPLSPAAKLPGTISLQVAPTVMFRCDARNDAAFVIAQSERSRDVVASLDVSAPAKSASTGVGLGLEVTEFLYSGVKWKSKTACDIVAKSHLPAVRRRKIGKAFDVKSNKQQTSLSEIFNKELISIKTEFKKTVCNWLECYDRVVANSALSASQNHSAAVSNVAELSRSTTFAAISWPLSARSSRCKSPYLLSMKPSELPDGSTIVYTPCPLLTRVQMLAKTTHNFSMPSFTCHCSKTRIPLVTDVELETFLNHCVSARQLVVIAVVAGSSSVLSKSLDSAGGFRGQLSEHKGQAQAAVELSPSIQVLDSIYRETNSSRLRPCFDAANDSYRLLLYDLLTAANDCDVKEPLLSRRHNVSPGMILIYKNAKLLFCDRIFNGFGHSRKDFQMQIQKSLRDASIGVELPKDFKLQSPSPIFASPPPNKYPSILISVETVGDSDSPPEISSFYPVPDSNALPTESLDVYQAESRPRSSTGKDLFSKRGKSSKNNRIDVNSLSASIS